MAELQSPPGLPADEPIKRDPRILSAVPTPPAQRWREVRLLYLPRTVFIVGGLVAIWLWSSWVAPATLVAEAEIQQLDVRSVQAGKLTTLKVDTLQSVHRGDVIGYVGSTGRSTGPHLHYEILANGKLLNPLQLLTKPTTRAGN